MVRTKTKESIELVEGGDSNNEGPLFEGVKAVEESVFSFSNKDLGGAYINLVFSLVIKGNIIGRAAIIEVSNSKGNNSIKLEGGLIDRFTLIRTIRPKTINDIKKNINKLGPISLVFNSCDLYGEYKEPLDFLVSGTLHRNGSISIEGLEAESIDFNSLPGDRLALNSISFRESSNSFISNALSINYLGYKNLLELHKYDVESVHSSNIPSDFY